MEIPSSTPTSMETRTTTSAIRPCPTRSTGTSRCSSTPRPPCRRQISSRLMYGCSATLRTVNPFADNYALQAHNHKEQASTGSFARRREQGTPPPLNIFVFHKNVADYIGGL